MLLSCACKGGGGKHPLLHPFRRTQILLKSKLAIIIGQLISHPFREKERETKAVPVYWHLHKLWGCAASNYNLFYVVWIHPFLI